jgi:predicted RecA/RadA family phage recombinase
MSAEALTSNSADNEVQLVATAAHSSGEVIQLPDGRAAIVAGLDSVAIGETFTAYVKGQYTVLKTASVVILDGGKLFWDRSAGKANFKQDVASGDFYLGVAVGDGASADTTIVVDLNVAQRNLIEWGKGIWDTVVVLTAGTVLPNPGTGLTGTDPGGLNTRFTFSATAEAQKVDAMSRQSVPVVSGSFLPFIAQGRVAIFNIGDNAALDINIGVASGTHATDADAIAESVFFHLDGTALDIKAESDDGTTEVAATDTTVDAVDDTYFEFWIDARVESSVKLYLDGVRVLSGSTFVLTAGAGPLKALFHMEKTSDDTLADVRIENFDVRLADVT